MLPKSIGSPKGSWEFHREIHQYVVVSRQKFERDGVGFVERLLDLLLGEGRNGQASAQAEAESSEPELHDEDIPGTIDLGWRYSDGRNEFQMAKVERKDRSTHMYVIGATGSGKTKFLESIIQQDIMERAGFAVIDPHGDLIEDIKGIPCDKVRQCRTFGTGDSRRSGR